MYPERDLFEGDQQFGRDQTHGSVPTGVASDSETFRKI